METASYTIRRQEAVHLDGAVIRSSLATHTGQSKDLILTDELGNSVLAVLDEAMLSRHVTGQPGRESLHAVLGTVMDQAIQGAKLIGALADEAFSALLDLRLPSKCPEELPPQPAVDPRMARLPLFTVPGTWHKAVDRDAAA